MSQYFPKAYVPFGGDFNVKVDLSNYATKTDLKNVSTADVSSFALMSNLASLKTEVDKIDTDKLKTVPIDLAKLSNMVKNDVVKKIEYNKLVTKVDNIDTTKKYLMLVVWLKKTDLHTKVTEIEGKIPDVSSLVTKSALTVVENKIPDVNSLVKKTDFNTTVAEIERKIPVVSSLVKKTDYATEIANIKNDCVTNAALNATHKDQYKKENLILK